MMVYDDPRSSRPVRPSANRAGNRVLRIVWNFRKNHEWPIPPSPYTRITPSSVDGSAVACVRDVTSFRPRSTYFYGGEKQKFVRTSEENRTDQNVMCAYGKPFYDIFQRCYPVQRRWCVDGGACGGVAYSVQRDVIYCVRRPAWREWRPERLRRRTDAARVVSRRCDGSSGRAYNIVRSCGRYSRIWVERLRAFRRRGRTWNFRVRNCPSPRRPPPTPTTDRHNTVGYT